MYAFILSGAIMHIEVRRWTWRLRYYGKNLNIETVAPMNLETLRLLSITG